MPADALYGIHTLRAIDNFPLLRRPVHSALIEAYGWVKLACAETNRQLGVWAARTQDAEAILQACRELAQGVLSDEIVVDALQGGAGTSLNMNANEVLSNRALQLLGCRLGDYDRISPLDDINLHQSTNDTFPTALRLAAILLLRQLEQHVLALQEAFQEKEREFAHIVKIGRTQLQDAVLTTLGREMGAYAEALNRDRWRIYKCEERLRVVNLGGTAIGTGIGAPRQYIFQVVDKLRELTGVGFARAENLVEATQNADVFVEVHGMLKAHAVTLLKICSDLRFMSSGPQAGLSEIVLPPQQAGSSIMPDKVNPVIPEAVSQAAMLVMGCDSVIAQACAAGNLELNPFLPLVAHCILEGLSLLSNANQILRSRCITGLTANAARCRELVENSTAVVTALVPLLGYQAAAEIAHQARSAGCSVREYVTRSGQLTTEQFDLAITPEAVTRLGHVDDPRT